MKKDSIINKALAHFGLKIVNASPLNADHGWRQMIGGLFSNAAKQAITNDTALQISTVFACMRNVSEDVAKMPLKIYQKQDRYKYEKPEHPLYNILQFRPNPEMTAQAFRETLTSHMLGWGNAYAEIEKDVRGNVIALWPLRPDRIEIDRDKNTKKLFYRVRNDLGQTMDLWADEILHIHGLGFDGIVGYNVIRYARECCGVAMASEKMAASFYGNGCHFGGNLRHPKNLSKEAQERLVAQIEKEYQGVDKAHRLLILEEGMEFNKNTIDPKESQFLESRQFSVPEICRWFRVPPHKVADLTKSAFSNIEQQNIDYVTDGLTAWCERWEQELWYKLLSPLERKEGYYFEHVVEGLLRGDIQTRTAAYKSQFDMGALTSNEIRALENRNPVEGGDECFVQLNLTTLKNAGKQQDQTINTDSMIDNIAERITSAENSELEKHVKFSGEREKFNKWCEGFYKKHNAYIEKQIEPLNISTDVNKLTLQAALLLAISPIDVFNLFKDLRLNDVKFILRGAIHEKK